MKHTLKIIGTAGIAGLILASFTSGINESSQQEPKKTRHIKMTKIENGKKMELDTILTNDDVFVWNGDTLNPVKHIRKFDEPGHENVMILKSDGRKGEPPMTWHSKSGKDIQVFTEAVGDSIRKKIIIRKDTGDGEEERVIIMDDPKMKHFAPMPPMPPMPPSNMRMLKQVQRGQMINLNDPNVVSFKKKDLKDGLEKIEIIRKKTDEPEDMMFRFQFNDQMEMPNLPGMEGDSQRMKIIEKRIKVDGEKNENIEIEVETEDNK
ncbi:MAG: hypothetical protein WAO52_20090 [Prolixibacteraceae bacterium]